ncbi:hypothetical protein [Mycolicibacterium gilvum]|uniref:hypothetical protein n=1 Tax=Mycolicibacterium gilvum TaxID=1804 RepID=UPI0040467944
MTRDRSVPSRLRPALAIGVGVCLVAALCVIIGRSDATISTQPFAADSPFRTPLEVDVPVDADSARIVARLSRDDGLYANLVDFAIPVYSADDDTPRTRVSCTITNWGPCPFTGHSVPIPDDAKPSAGSDGAMVVIDPDAQLLFEFWRAREKGGQWTTSFGAVNRLDGSGWGTHSSGFSTASGASRLAGVIRVDEMRHGEIPHALALQSDSVCANVFRAPAIKTDGTYRGADCVPAGARLRLDPDVDIDALNLGPAERVIARALQTYGAFVVDSGGAALSVAFERDTDAAADSPGATYEEGELLWDYSKIGNLPWERLQVLA